MVLWVCECTLLVFVVGMSCVVDICVGLGVRVDVSLLLVCTVCRCFFCLVVLRRLCSSFLPRGLSIAAGRCLSVFRPLLGFPPFFSR